ncbi:MAG: polysaccharide deacetylase family protein [Bacillota bacterium]|nr:polysaccharide deacetylase family protein [Bacillota bacterium]
MEENRKDKKRSRWNIALAVAAAVFAAASIALYVSPQMMFRVYDNEDEFRSHVDQRYRQMNVLPEAGNRVVTAEYSDSAATAVRFDPLQNEELAVFRDQRIRDIQNSYRKRIAEAEAAREKKHGDDMFYRSMQHVLLVDTAVYDSGTGALTLAIYTEEYREKDEVMEKTDSTIDTWLLAKEDLRPLKTVQVMTPDYREKASVFTREYLRTTVAGDRFNEGGEAWLDDKEENYNKFVISSNSITFFFDQDTVLKRDQGVVAVSMLRSYMGPAVRAGIVERFIDPDKPMVALTYDDGPGGDAERRIHRCLKKHNVVATFFYLGNRVKSDAETAKSCVAIGCEIGNHSWDHAELTSLSKEDIRREISRTNKVIARVTGVRPILFRPPYGSTSDKIRKQADMPEILWTVDTLDWKSRDAKMVFKTVKKTRKLDGKIILMHSLYDETAEATEKIVPWLLENGYQIVTVSELIKYKTGESPRAGETYE